MFKRIVFLILLSGIISLPVIAQKKKVSLKDTLDHQLDFSDYLINMHGFVPWPSIISEPALGNFGVALALVFVSPHKNTKGDEMYHFPDITGVAGMWTLNNSWGVAALRQGTFPSLGMRYTVIVAYAPLNVEFYRTSQYFGEKSFLFKFSSFYGAVDVSENIWKNKIFGGIKYEYTGTKISWNYSDRVDSLKKYFNWDIPNHTYSYLGNLYLYAEWDNRNSIFTPDKGIRLKGSYGLERTWLGGDENFDQFLGFTTIFLEPVKPWICGLKAEYQWITDDVPFYVYPYLNMRGLPAAKYQGQQTLLFETEQRFDFLKRWSALAFAGTGRTYSTNRIMKDDTWHWAGGVGFRYLLARLFKMRMGVDVALGPGGQFAYYIVLGQYWNKF